MPLATQRRASLLCESNAHTSISTQPATGSSASSSMDSTPPVVMPAPCADGRSAGPTGAYFGCSAGVSPAGGGVCTPGAGGSAGAGSAASSCARALSSTVCGTRGWLYNAETPEDRKIVARENGRLTLSLEAAQKLGGTPVVFLHYPPVYDTAECAALLDTMQRFGVTDCYYGHIHGDRAAKKAPVGEYRGIRMNLVSCDYIRFVPKLVRLHADCK